MANRFLNNITINDEYTLPAADGTTDQVLTTDGAGQLVFVDQDTIASGSAEVVEVPVKNVSGSGLTKGDPVYISGSVGASGRLEVQLADAGNSAKMPALGLLKQDLANNGEGFAVVTGKLRNLVTSPIDGVTPSEGDVVYVKSGGSTGAALTTTKPTGASNLIQNMGKVGRVSTAADGTYVVSSILRSNDVPNLNTGKIWVGDGNTIESSVVFLDEANARMGINTTSPSEALYVIGNVRASGNFIGTNAYWSSTFGNKGTNQGIRFEAPSTSLQTARVDADAFAVNFGGTGGAGEVFRILEGGNVGIGTTSPAEKLTVSGDSNITGKLAVGLSAAHPSIAFYNQNDAYFNGAVTVDDTFTQSGGGLSSFSGQVTITGTADLDGAINDNSGSTGTSGQVLTAGTGGQTVWADAATGTVTGTGAATQVAFWDGTSSLDGDANLYFDSVNKRLGIGTSSPTNPLTVVGSNSISIDDYIIHNGDTDTYFGFSSDGNVSFVNNAGNEMLVYDGGVRVYNTLRSNTEIQVDGTIIDNGGSTGTSGQVLSSTGTGVDWIDAASGGVSSITAGTGLTGGTITSSGTIAVDYAGNDNFILASGAEKTSPATSDYIAIVDLADLSKPVKYAEIGNLPSSGGSAQLVSYNFSANHSSNNTAYYYQFRNQSNSSMVQRAVTWPNWGGQYYADLTVPDDCFLKSFVIRSRNSSTWASGLQIKMRIKKNKSTTEYDGAFVTSTGSGEDGQITFSLTSSDTSFVQGDSVAIGFNATGAMGYITAVATFELT
jgi:hypothetical protein